MKELITEPIERPTTEKLVEGSKELITDPIERLTTKGPIEGSTTTELKPITRTEELMVNRTREEPPMGC